MYNYYIEDDSNNTYSIIQHKECLDFDDFMNICRSVCSSFNYDYTLEDVVNKLCCEYKFSHPSIEYGFGIK